MSVIVDCDYTLTMHCDECGGSMSEGGSVYCRECYSDSPDVGLADALECFPLRHCSRCDRQRRSIFMVDKLVGSMCIGCAKRYEAELFQQAVKA